MEAEIVIVRHGETGANRDRVIQGQSEFMLNAAGLKQAERVAEKLRALTFRAAFSSDLSRAMVTARTILEANQESLELIGNKDLRERSFGVLEGRAFTEFHSEARANFESQGVKSAWLYTPKGGETVEEMRTRAEKFFEELCASLASEFWTPASSVKILVVSHGGLIKELLCYLAQDRNCRMPNEKYKQISPNTGVTRIMLKLSSDRKLLGLECLELHAKDHLHGTDDIGVNVGC